MITHYSVQNASFYSVFNIIASVCLYLRFAVTQGSSPLFRGWVYASHLCGKEFWNFAIFAQPQSVCIGIEA
jgi:hypothetical protein